MVLSKERLLEDAVAEASETLFERRRKNNAWKDAMEDRRRNELLWESGAVSLDPLLRDGIVLHSRERFV